jgi:glycosyltransferase involved in cell wall biosynthesis
VDLLPWICGTIARRIAYHNQDWMEATVCSSFVLRDLIARRSGFPGEIDLVHFLTEYDAEIHLDRFADKVPCVMTVHHVEGERTLAPEPRCDAIAILCRQWKEDVLGRGVDADKIVTCPDGVDADHFQPTRPSDRACRREANGLPPDAFVIGFCGKRTSDSSGRKGIDTFLRAIDRLPDRLPGACLLIVGPGWADVVEHVRCKGLTCVHVPFIASHGEFARIYQCLDTYWVTSRIEGGPVPVLEAMSSGVPCVSTPVGMAADLIRHGENGFLIPFDDADSVLERTRELFRDPGLRSRMGDAARQTILDGYQWSQTTRTAWPLYRKAFDRFEARRPDARLPLILEPQAQAPAPPGSFDGPYLAAIPAGQRKWVVAKEHFLFIDALRAMNEHAIAGRLDAEQDTLRHSLSLGWRSAAYDSLMSQGWTAFMKGDRPAAKEFAVSSILRSPWRRDGWRLLACAWLKTCPPATKERVALG